MRIAVKAVHTTEVGPVDWAAFATLLRERRNAAHGNYHELPRYSMLTQPRDRCRRLYTLLGLTRNRRGRIALKRCWDGPKRTAMCN